MESKRTRMEKSPPRVRDYKKEVRIDFHNLHENWQEQSELYADYSEEYANAISRVDKLKERIRVREARVDLEVRTDPDSYGVTKMTDTAVKAIITLDEALIEMRKDLIQAIYDNNIMRGATQSFSQRKSALEWICRLWISNYFAVPNISRDVPKEIVDKMTQEMYNKSLEDSDLRSKLSKKED